MLADVVHEYGDIVDNWSVSELSHDGPNIRLKARVEFQDRSVLYIRQIVIAAYTFKYAYHWQDENEQLICRWDNAPHWHQLSTQPHHKHLALGEPPVADTEGGDIKAVFEKISGNLRK